MWARQRGQLIPSWNFKQVSIGGPVCIVRKGREYHLLFFGHHCYVSLIKFEICLAHIHATAGWIGNHFTIFLSNSWIRLAANTFFNSDVRREIVFPVSIEKICFLANGFL